MYELIVAVAVTFHNYSLSKLEKIGIILLGTSSPLSTVKSFATRRKRICFLVIEGGTYLMLSYLVKYC